MLKGVCWQWSLLRDLWTWGSVVISLPSVLYRTIFSSIVASLCGHQFHWCKWEALDFVPYDRIWFASAKLRWLKSEIQLGSVSDPYNVWGIEEELSILLQKFCSLHSKSTWSLPSETTGRALAHLNWLQVLSMKLLVVLQATHKWSNIPDDYPWIYELHHFMNKYHFLLWLVSITVHMWNIGKLIDNFNFFNWECNSRIDS